ncbi:MAG: hypothetical protein M5U22_04375 [Thermoleophilia bacterium]|nr:hypothetical protein [Thermoleophilia bacterium]
MKRILKLFGFLSLIGSAAAGVYYYFFVRQEKPQVELYFDDGSMLALQGSAPEAAPFLGVADDILAKSPVMV